jgi:hypothetical protein
VPWIFLKIILGQKSAITLSFGQPPEEFGVSKLVLKSQSVIECKWINYSGLIYEKVTV